MNPHPIIQAAEKLCAILMEENAALLRMDVGGVTLLLIAKRRATDSLLQAQRQGKMMRTSDALSAASRLKTLVSENKVLLERAITAQNRVMACIARAVPKAMDRSGRYGSGGHSAAPHSMPPVALSARA